VNGVPASSDTWGMTDHLVFRFWRQFSAIPLAAADGNPSTAPDPDWRALVLTPNHQQLARLRGIHFRSAVRAP
jgi:hypothetical protein